MEKILISEFKAKCIAILKRVQTSREAVIITRRGRPIARIEPMPESEERHLGASRGRMTLHTDITREDSDLDWEMLGGSSS